MQRLEQVCAASRRVAAWPPSVHASTAFAPPAWLPSHSPAHDRV